MTHAEAACIAAFFWSRAGATEPFPRSLESSVLWALPLAIVKLPRLRLSSAEGWLGLHRVPSSWSVPDRAVRACLVAGGGSGVVFLDGADPLDELRFSLGHETAHFILDHYLPRARAVALLGDSILEVLDGRRGARTDERLSAVLGGVELGAYMHLLDRSADGDVTHGRAVSAEDRADRLALELLAPRSSVAAAVRRTRAGGWHNKDMIQTALTEQFGLPIDVAARYAVYLARGDRTSTSFREWLGVESRLKAVELRISRGNRPPGTKRSP